MKTMEDFPRLKSVHPDASWGLIRRSDLKKEAIEYIKDMEGFVEKNKGKVSVREHDEDAMLSGAIRWIKHFFNITDDDVNVLKGDEQ